MKWRESDFSSGCCLMGNSLTGIIHTSALLCPCQSPYCQHHYLGYRVGSIHVTLLFPNPYQAKTLTSVLNTWTDFLVITPQTMLLTQHLHHVSCESFGYDSQYTGACVCIPCKYHITLDKTQKHLQTFRPGRRDVCVRTKLLHIPKVGERGTKWNL